MINSTTLVGRLTRDPELKHTPNQQPYVYFTLAVNRNFKNQSTGEREADFISCVIWGSQAEKLSEWCRKGHLIGITGRIQTRSYEDGTGRKVYVTEVVAGSFQNFESRRDNGSNANSLYGQEPPYNPVDDDLPF
ncbi:TPA: single-stranded DNA-binding protein [Streptococcus suis]|nr:single-stranded DNA-binding protein [Streptococcus suis]